MRYWWSQAYRAGWWARLTSEMRRPWAEGQGGKGLRVNPPLWREESAPPAFESRGVVNQSKVLTKPHTGKEKPHPSTSKPCITKWLRLEGLWPVGLQGYGLNRVNPKPPFGFGLTLITTTTTTTTTTATATTAAATTTTTTTSTITTISSSSSRRSSISYTTTTTTYY